MDANYNGSNSFRVFNNLTSEFVFGRRVKMDCGNDGVKYASVVSSSYLAPYTTVVIDESDLTTSLTDVWYAVVTAGASGSIPIHSHDGSEGQGGTISGTGGTVSGTDDHEHAAYVPWDFGSGTISGTGDIYCNDIYTASGTVYIGDLKLSTDGTNLLVDDQPIEATGGGEGGSTTFSGLADTPDVYDEGKYLRSTVSGTEWATVSGGGSSDVQSFTDLDDTPSTYSGTDGQYLISTGSGIEFTDVTSTDLYDGAGVPSNGLGKKYDYYIDLDNNDLYKKDVQNYGSNIATGGTASAQSVAGGSSAANAVDGSFGTYWEPAAPNTHWWKYDFGAGNEQQVNKVSIYKADYERMGLVNVYGSNNDTNWTFLGTATAPHQNNYWLDIVFEDSEVSYRYIRLDISVTFSGWTIRIPELYMFSLTSWTWQKIGNTNDGALLQDGSVPLTGDLSYGANTISGTGDIYAGALYIDDSASIDMYASDLEMTNNTLAGDVALIGQGAPTNLPTFINDAATIDSGGGSTLVCDKPTGTQVGDYMVACITIEGSSPGVSLSGWQLIDSISNSNIYSFTLYKVAGGSEPSNYTFNISGTNTDALIAISTFRYVSGIGNYDSQSNGFSTNGTSPSINIVNDNELVIHYVSSGSGVTFTGPPGWDIESFIRIGTSSTGIAQQFAIKYFSIGGTGTTTSVPSSSSELIGGKIALKPLTTGQYFTMIRGTPGSSVKVYHGGQLALETTTSGGINVYGTISGTDDIYCNDIYTSSGTVYIGDVQLTTSGGELLVDGQTVVGTPGASGTNGVDGIDGADGATWTSASGVPAQEDGNYEDYYLDLETYDIYKKDVSTYGLTDLFTGGTTSANADWPGTNNAWVVDGNTGTAWLSNTTTNAWWKYDFGSGVSHAVSKLRIYPRADGADRNIKDYEIQGSNNDSDWDLLYSDTMPNGTPAWEDVEFSNAEAYRYIRIMILNTYNNFGGLSEAEAYDATGFDWGVIGNIKGTDGADAPTTFLGLTDTPNTYSGTDGQYIISTGSGIDFTQPSPAPAEGNWVLVATIEADNETISESIPWDGNTNPRIRIESFGASASASVYMRPNGDSGAAYCRGNIRQDGGSAQATWSSTETGVAVIPTSVDSFNLIDGYLKNTGTRRFFIAENVRYDIGNTDRINFRYAYHWPNTGDDVTSITISSDGSNATGEIKVYRWQDITEAINTTLIGLDDTPATYSGTDGQYLQSTGSGTVWATVSGGGGSDGWTYSDELATTSGTILTFDNIPSGVTSVEVMLAGVRTSTNSQPPIIQLGDAGGIETTGYDISNEVGASTTDHTTDGWRTTIDSIHLSTMGHYGSLKLRKFIPSQELWLGENHFMISGGNNIRYGSGFKTLSEELTSIALTTPGGSATFTHGSATIRYK